jgi:leucyl/phenylalanyl-tRNA--protein transferase
MPVYLLPEHEIVFPSPHMARGDGLLALGGDLRTSRLLAAYRSGIFPWYMDGEPILWWSPDPRLVLYPEAFHVARRLRRLIRQQRCAVTVDRDFAGVIRACADTHLSRDGGTWIVPDMIDAYVALHQAGYAHSVEVWQGEELAGGLYGVSLGGAFFGESMFSRRRDASKVGLVRLVEALAEKGFTLIDCQVTTEHLMRFGAREISRARFLSDLQNALRVPTLCGRWQLSPKLETVLPRPVDKVSGETVSGWGQ